MTSALSHQEKIEHLKNLIMERHWRKVQVFYKKHRFEDALCFYETQCCANCVIKGHTILNFCLRYNPPLFIVKFFIDFFPEFLKEADCMQRLPIHHAVENGTFPEVVSYLVTKEPTAGGLVDKYGKTVLHLAVDGYASLKKRMYRDETSFEMFRGFGDVIDILTSAAPNSILFEDMYGKNVIQYAMEECDISVISKLKQVSEEWMANANKKRSSRRFSARGSIKLCKTASKRCVNETLKKNSLKHLSEVFFKASSRKLQKISGKRMGLAVHGLKKLGISRNSNSMKTLYCQAA